MTRKSDSLQRTREDRRSLKTLCRSGTSKNRQHPRARILDLLDRKVPPAASATPLSCALSTVYNVKRRSEAEGVAAALSEKPRSGRPIESEGTQRAKLPALACSPAPAGQARWSLRLLADTAIALGFVDHLSHPAVKAILKKTACART